MSTLLFTLIQSDLHWENKQANLQMFEEKIMGIDVPTHIVMLPEMFSTGFSMKPDQLAEPIEGETFKWMNRIASMKKIILAGSLIIEEKGKFYNRLIWMLPNGQWGHYDKKHLFAYGEEDRFYTPGTSRVISSVNGWKINLQVCYDLRFPVWARQQFGHNNEFEYDVLIYVANWPEKRNTAWKTLLRARAIENQCYVVGVNRTGTDGNDIYYSGDSMVIDPLGEVLYHKEKEDDVATVGLSKDHLQEVRDKFPFWRDADDFQLIV